MQGEEKNSRAKWAIMLYMAADATLTNFAVESLKQLKAHANEEVVVAAQLEQGGRIHGPRFWRFRFAGDGDPEAKLESNSQPFHGHEPQAMTDVSSLTDFLEWAQKQCPAERYCLVLWGHGPELLFEPPATHQRPGGQEQLAYEKKGAEPRREHRLYFTPVQLATALREAQSRTGCKIDVIGFDACSMSMIEVAYEIRELAGYMVASQEEVPDLSFPYGELVKQFSDPNFKGDVGELCRKSVDAYIRAYQDYICNSETDIAGLTLSAVRLDRITAITEPFTNLVKLLRSCSSKKEGRQSIHSARRASQGFVGGLFVDLSDFCRNLGKQPDVALEIKTACDEVAGAIQSRTCDHACVIANSDSSSPDSHGISIYFPYLRDGRDVEEVERNLVKGPGGDTIGKGPGGDTIGKGPGGDTIGKGPGGDTIGKNALIVNTAAVNIRYAVRRELIADTEDYYKLRDFEFANDTGWYDFIQQDWSRTLVETELEDLDLRYSARQCALNLLLSGNRPQLADQSSEAKRPGLRSKPVAFRAPA